MQIAKSPPVLIAKCLHPNFNRRDAETQRMKKINHQDAKRKRPRDNGTKRRPEDGGQRTGRQQKAEMRKVEIGNADTDFTD
jgi:hypothetical protein